MPSHAAFQNPSFQCPHGQSPDPSAFLSWVHNHNQGPVGVRAQFWVVYGQQKEEQSCLQHPDMSSMSRIVKLRNAQGHAVLSTCVDSLTLGMLPCADQDDDGVQLPGGAGARWRQPAAPRGAVCVAGHRPWPRRLRTAPAANKEVCILFSQISTYAPALHCGVVT